MKLSLAFALTLLLAPAIARANFDAAVKAYRHHRYNDAYTQFLKLARRGDARAQTIVALMNKFGESVPADDQAAFHWYMKAARQGYPPALYEVGTMYASGKGVARDKTAAIAWLERAVKAGYARAGNMLAQLGNKHASRRNRTARHGPWSKPWNFRLPNRIREADAKQPAPPAEATWRVDLGARDTWSAAGRLWDALAQHEPAMFRGLNPVIRLDGDTRHRKYRVQAGPFDSLAAARGFCDRLQRDIRIRCQPVTRLGDSGTASR